MRAYPTGLSRFKRIVVLTGVEICESSELSVISKFGGFREDQHSTTNITQTPQTLWDFFGPLREHLLTCAPGSVHASLAHWERRIAAHNTLTIITENVDGLHQRAGSRNVIELRGAFQRTRCSNVNCRLHPFEDHIFHRQQPPRCPLCGAALRPDIYLAGERIAPEAEWLSKRAVRQCDLFIALGVSDKTWPALEFARTAGYGGAMTLLVNSNPPQPANPVFEQEIAGKLSETLPELLSQW
jgi:NAD-dependent deacetylase